MKFNRSSFKHFVALYGVAVSLLFSQSALYCIWQPPVIVSDPSIDVETAAGGAVLNVNSQGNALSIWTNVGSSTFPDQSAIASSFYIRGVGWQPPLIISSLAQNDADGPLYTDQMRPDIALNALGVGVAVWDGEFSEEPNFPRVIIAARRNANGIWTAVENISDESGDLAASKANVDVNEEGTSLSAWRSLDIIGNESIAISFLPFEGLWTVPFYFFPDKAIDDESKPYPVINSSGNAVVTWLAKTTEPDTFYIKAATYYALTASWSDPIILDTILGASPDIGRNPRCDMNASGNAVAIWQIDGKAKAAHFNGSHWEQPVILGDTEISILNYGADIVIDPNGFSTAVWQGPAPDHSVFASSRLLNGEWSLPQIISVSGRENAFNQLMSQEPLVVSKEGNVIALWTEFLNAGRNIRTAFKPFGEDWHPSEIVTTPSREVSFLNIGLASCGFAVSLWQENPSTVMGNTFVKSAVNENLILPHGAIGKHCCDSFAMQKRCVNVLKWDSDDCVLSFNIYRDGVLIANVSNSSALKYIDPLGCKKESHVYTVSAINIWGFEGDPVPVVFE